MARRSRSVTNRGCRRARSPSRISTSAFSGPQPAVNDFKRRRRRDTERVSLLLMARASGCGHSIRGSAARWRARHRAARLRQHNPKWPPLRSRAAPTASQYAPGSPYRARARSKECPTVRPPGRPPSPRPGPGPATPDGPPSSAVDRPRRRRHATVPLRLVSLLRDERAGRTVVDRPRVRIPRPEAIKRRRIRR